MYSIKHYLLFTGLVMLSSTVAAQSRPSVSSNAARITTLESEVQIIKDEVATIELTPGPKGDKGDTGAQGIQGPKGDTGAQGEQGPAGLDGMNGIDGAPGADGQDGVGAIEGTAFGQMQFWDGDAWQTIQSPDVNSADAQVLTFLNGAFTWQVPASSGPTTYEVGDTGPAGGIVFWVNEAGTSGLEAAPADVVLDDTSSFEWGCDGEFVAGTSTGINTGSANTSAILAENEDGDTGTCGIIGTEHEAALAAARYQYDGFSDWFLPSKDELNALYQNKGVVGGFADADYWSSSQYDSYYAWYQDFYDGYQDFDNQGNVLRVRAVRAF